MRDVDEAIKEAAAETRSVLAEGVSPRKADVVKKVVGDFRKWKDHDAYAKAFDRLLRDLKSEKLKPDS